MVWQEHVEQIVMLTNLMEGPKVNSYYSFLCLFLLSINYESDVLFYNCLLFSKSKCFQYWPDLEETMDRDMFTLHTDTERHYACYSIRKLRLTYNEEVRLPTSL